jgi:hypothetical protein
VDDGHAPGARQDEATEAGPDGRTTVEPSPYVAVPAFPRGTRQNGSVVFKQVMLAGGQRAVMAFTTREKLIEAFGEFQPWLVIPLDNLRVLVGPLVDVVCVDPVVGDDIPRWTREDLIAALNSKSAHSYDQVQAQS